MAWETQAVGLTSEGWNLTLGWYGQKNWAERCRFGRQGWTGWTKAVMVLQSRRLCLAWGL